MKSRQAVLLGAVAIGFAVGAPQAMAGGSSKITLPTGNFSLTSHGSEASCSGASCVVLSIIEAGAEFRDGMGNACGTHAAVVNTDPPGASPPTVVPSVTTVLKVIHYDLSSGTGDESLNEYSGGSCNGATFNSGGATKLVTGTLHFTVSNGGNRIDSVVTALTLSGLGGYSISFTELQQNPENAQ
jgi:hypothetical protein